MPAPTRPAARPETILMFDRRPCVITGTAQQRHANPKHGYFHVELIRFLDGAMPANARVPRGKFKAAKRPPPAQQAYWSRVDGLVACGKSAADAKREALATEAAGGGEQQQKLMEW